MPLSGTIQDFGVADIFQLISQQAKTGRLTLSNDHETVMVLFREGAVVHAENTKAPSDRLLGAILLRAEVIDAPQLRRALEEQQRTLKRIGSVLIDLGVLDEPTVAEFARLQMTETLYALFGWSKGIYEFETAEVESSSRSLQAIRAEHVVMNGIRMTDEWPFIREQIPSYTWMVERMRPLPPARARPAEDDVLGLGLGSALAPVDAIGDAERLVYGLIAPNRTVQKLIDLSRLGEFETCRALSELMGGGYIRIVKPRPPERLGPTRAQRLRVLLVEVGRALVSCGLVVLAGGLLARGLAEWRAPRELEVAPRAIERRVEAIQLRVIERSVEVYRLRHGRYPETLEALVEDGLLEATDLARPYEAPYHYRLEETRFRVRAPVR